MKKLQEISLDELRELYNSNDDFRYRVYEEIQEENGFWYRDRYYEYFEKNGRGYNDGDHYGNVFFRLTDIEEFMRNGIRKEARDYFSEENQKHFDELWNLWDTWTDLTWEEQDSKKGEKIYEKMESEAKIILEAIEDDLNDILTIHAEDEDYILERIAEGESYMSNWKTNGTLVYWEETHILR